MTTYGRLFLLALTCGAAAFAQNSTNSSHTSQFSFPPVGLAATETAQINVVNLAPNPSSGTAASCSGSISFLDSSGASIGSAASFTVTSGQIFSAPLPYSSTGGSGSRALIRGLVQLMIASSSNAPCMLSSSLETFDTSSGVTHLVLTGASQGAFAPLGGPGQRHF